MKRFLPLFVFSTAAAAAWLTWRRRDSLPGALFRHLPGRSASGSVRREPWREYRARSLNAVERPPSAVAREQHTDPMRRSEQIVDEAFVAHGPHPEDVQQRAQQAR